MASYTSMPSVETKPEAHTNPETQPAERRRHYTVRVIALLFFLAVVVVTVVVLQFTLKNEVSEPASATRAATCTDDCTVSLVESIPQGVVYPAGSPQHPAISQGWMDLLQLAEDTIDIASFYWTLRGSDTHTKDPSSKPGEQVYQGLIDAATKRNIKIRVVQTVPSKQFPNLDTEELAKVGADVRSLDMKRLLSSGIIHTKMWLVDKKHFYVGSANLDWRALTQIQELGIITYNCSCMGSDMAKIFDVYWDLALPHSKIPSPWPEKYFTDINLAHPAELTVNNTDKALMYLASSPPQLCPPGRTDDLSAILNIIRSATKFIYVAVMDYFPTTLYTGKRSYWPVIDDALRRAAFDGHVSIRLMASLWNHTRSDLKNYLKSLASLNTANNASVEVKLFKVPMTKHQAEIPYIRVNHNKFMVTESTAYVGTSNWAADYFLYTGGISQIINDTAVQAQVQAVFERNWNSKFAVPVV